MVKPKYGIISCGKDNEFGHPHESTLTNFKDVNARVYRTDELGTIVIGILELVYLRRMERLSLIDMVWHFFWKSFVSRRRSRCGGCF